MNWDLRKHDPYSVYPRFDFDVPTGNRGDAYDRARVRLFECYESAEIIEQAVAQLTAGPVKAEGFPRLLTPRPGEAYDHIESARGSLGRLYRVRRQPAPIPREVPLAGVLQPRIAAACSPRGPRCRTWSSTRFARPGVRGGGPVNGLRRRTRVGPWRRPADRACGASRRVVGAAVWPVASRCASARTGPGRRVSFQTLADTRQAAAQRGHHAVPGGRWRCFVLRRSSCSSR